MFRKVFASFVLAGITALILFACFAIGADVAIESFVLEVGPGQYLVKLARAAGWKDKAYLEIVKLNPDIWPEGELYHKSHNFVPVGLKLRVPREVAVAVGLVPWTPTIVKPAPVTPAQPVSLVVASKGPGWSDWLVLTEICLAFLFFTLMVFEKPIRRAGTMLKPVYGEYLVNFRAADGAVHSERRAFNGEWGYSPQGTNGQTVVFPKCGNVARRTAGTSRKTLSDRLIDAARNTFRPESSQEPVVLLPRPRLVPIVNEGQWNIPVVLRQGRKKGELILDPVWKVPRPA